MLLAGQFRLHRLLHLLDVRLSDLEAAEGGNAVGFPALEHAVAKVKTWRMLSEEGGGTGARSASTRAC